MVIELLKLSIQPSTDDGLGFGNMSDLWTKHTHVLFESGAWNLNATYNQRQVSFHDETFDIVASQIKRAHIVIFLTKTPLKTQNTSFIK